MPGSPCSTAPPPSSSSPRWPPRSACGPRSTTSAPASRARRGRRPQAVRLFEPRARAAGVLAAPVRRHARWCRASSRATGRWCSSASPIAPTSARPRWRQMAQAQKQWAATARIDAAARAVRLGRPGARHARDRIGEYAHAFHRDTLAATADVPALEQFARSLSMVYMKVPAAEGRRRTSTRMDHSAAMVVLDPQGRHVRPGPAAARSEGDRRRPARADQGDRAMSLITTLHLPAAAPAAVVAGARAGLLRPPAHARTG